jgi:hypothetical protein
VVEAVTLTPVARGRVAFHGSCRVADPHSAGDLAQGARVLVTVKDDRSGFAVPVDGERELLIAQRVRAQPGGVGVGLAVEGDQLCPRRDS